MVITSCAGSYSTQTVYSFFFLRPIAYVRQIVTAATMTQTRSTTKRTATVSKTKKDEVTSTDPQAAPARSDPVGFTDPRFWAFLFDWQFYILVALAFSYPISMYLQPYVGEDNGSLLRMGGQLAFVLFFFHYMGRRNEQLGFI